MRRYAAHYNKAYRRHKQLYGAVVERGGLVIITDDEYPVGKRRWLKLAKQASRKLADCRKNWRRHVKYIQRGVYYGPYSKSR